MCGSALNVPLTKGRILYIYRCRLPHSTRRSYRGAVARAEKFGWKAGDAIVECIGASDIVVQCGDLVDHGLTGSGGRAEDQQRQFVAQGEKIIAVQYRKVSFKFLSSKSVDKATLAKEARWVRYDRPRSLYTDGEELVEVSLEDDLSLEDLREICITESGEMVFSNIQVNMEEKS